MMQKGKWMLVEIQRNVEFVGKKGEMGLTKTGKPCMMAAVTIL